MDEVILGLDESHRAFVEALMLYGASSTGLGVVASIAANDATSKKVTITSASWSPGLWAQMEGQLRRVRVGRHDQSAPRTP